MSSKDRAYIRLAIAVSKQAALDYEREWRRFKKTGIKSDEMLELEEFFTSDYGNLVTLGKGKEILTQIQSGVPVEEFDDEDHSVRKGRYKYITFKGVTKSLYKWSRILGISYGTLRKRLHDGWSIERAFTTPVKEYRNGKSEEAV